MFLSHVTAEFFYTHDIIATGAFRVNVFVRGQQMFIPGCRPFLLDFRLVREDLRAVHTPPMGFFMFYLTMLFLIPPNIHLLAFWAVKRIIFVFQIHMFLKRVTLPYKVTARAPFKKSLFVLPLSANLVYISLQMLNVVPTGDPVTGPFARLVTVYAVTVPSQLPISATTLKAGMFPTYMHFEQSINLLAANRAGKSVFIPHVFPTFFLGDFFLTKRKRTLTCMIRCHMRFITFSPYFFADKTIEFIDGFMFLFPVLLPIRFRNRFFATFAKKLSFRQTIAMIIP
jgi:hypothetical protein